MDIRPIETVYNGYRFRSRLEARWAVFFDAAGIKYQYEPEGFEAKGGVMYLPDFYMLDFDVYVEVKGNRNKVWDDIRRMEKLIVWGGKIRRILILSDIPNNYDGGMWHFPIMLYSEGKYSNTKFGWWFFHDGCNKDGQDICEGNISSADYYPPWEHAYGNSYTSHRKLTFQAVSDTILRREKGQRAFHDVYDVFGCETDIEGLKQMNYDFNKHVFKAFEVARQARFEHGETPKAKVVCV